MPGKPANIIRFTTTTDGAEQFAAILGRAVEHINQENGTTTWFASRVEGEPTAFFLVDVFADIDGRTAHFSGEAAELILGEGGPLLDGQPELSALELITGKNV
jgi:quinol monooxygenase YgiN